MTVYTRHLTNALNKVEEVCGLHLLSDKNVKLNSLPIKEFITEFDLLLSESTQKDVDAINISIGRFMPSIAYLKSRMEFYRHTRLDFSNHKRIDLVMQVLDKFLNKDTINKDSKREIAIIVEHLSVLEETNLMYISSLGYRYLRLFIIFLCLGNYSDAKIIAELIISQVLIAENYVVEEEQEETKKESPKNSNINYNTKTGTSGFKRKRKII